MLFVCTANICRSPTATVLLRRRLNDLGIGEAVTLTSAGTAAASGRPWCHVASTWLGSSPDVGSFKGQHASRRLSQELVQEADLVLTADRGHRGAVVLLEPSARAIVFTLAEAAALARVAVKGLHPVGADGRVVNAPRLAPDASVETRLRWFISELDASRGLIQLGDPPPSAWQRRLGRHPQSSTDIPDPHGTGRGTHKRGLSLLDAASASFGTSLERVVTFTGEA